jgi:hypothetical protein
MSGSLQKWRRLKRVYFTAGPEIFPFFHREARGKEALLVI